MRLAGYTVLLLLASAGPGFAQAPRPAADPIAALLNPGAQPAVDEDQAERTGQAPVDPEPEAALPATPLAPAAPPPAHAVGVEETGKSPEGPPSLRDLAYDSRIRASFAAAESFQGPLDGGWTLGAAGQGDLFGLQIVDRRNRLEGAWRDLRGRPGPDAHGPDAHSPGANSPGAHGFVDRIQRSGGAVTLSFTPADGAPVTVALQGEGRLLSGVMDQAGRRTPVTLRRTSP